MTEPSISLKDVELRYPVYHGDTRSLRNAMVRWGTRGRLGKSVSEGMYVVGLKGISLNLKKGETLGVIGPNGAGKSTLLRLLAGVYAPTSGIFRRQGSVTTLFDIGLGLDEEATGIENIFLMSYMRGRTKSEIKASVDEIVNFSGLGEFIEMPLRVYSGGMRMRLAFSISTAIDPDILLIDEVFGAGDSDFARRSHERMVELMESARILVFSSHNNALVKDFCKHALYLRHGEIRGMGPADEVIDEYEEEVRAGVAAEHVAA